MRVIIRRNKQSTHQGFTNTSFLSNRYGFWGNVTAVDSKTNKVRVLSTTGYEYIGIPVCSHEWVNKQEDKFSGSRNLPAVGSRVFVLMPTGTITGAFVLCSGYAEGDTETHDLWTEDKENEVKTVTQNGWTKIEDTENNLISLESSNGNVKLELIPNGEDANINLKAFNFTLKITKDGIDLVSENDSVAMTVDKPLKIDSGSNAVTIQTSNFKVTKDGTKNLLEVS